MGCFCCFSFASVLRRWESKNLEKKKKKEGLMCYQVAVGEGRARAPVAWLYIGVFVRICDICVCVCGYSSSVFRGGTSGCMQSSPTLETDKRSRRLLNQTLKYIYWETRRSVDGCRPGYKGGLRRRRMRRRRKKRRKRRGGGLLLQPGSSSRLCLI